MENNEQSINRDIAIGDQCIKLSEIAWKNFHSRRDVEWKFCLALWAALATTVGVLWKQSEPGPSGVSSSDNDKASGRKHFRITVDATSSSSTKTQGLRDVKDKYVGGFLFGIVFACVFGGFHLGWFLRLHQRNKLDQEIAKHFETQVIRINGIPPLSENTEVQKWQDVVAGQHLPYGWSGPIEALVTSILAFIIGVLATRDLFQ